MAVGAGCLWIAGYPTLVAAAEVQASPRLEFATSEHDFGQINAGDVVSVDFAFTNTGRAALEITNVKPSCGCTTAEKSQQTIAPGEAGVIPVNFNSRNFSGRVSKTIRVTSNDPLQPEQTLRIHADIWTPVQLEPKTTIFNYENGVPTEETKVVRIRNNRDEPLELLPPESTHPAFHLDLKTVQPGREYELAVRLLPSEGMTGTVSMPLSLRTPSSQEPLVQTRLYAFEKEAVQVTPKVIRLASDRLETPQKVLVTIRNQGRTPLELSDPQSSLPDVALEIRELKAGQLFQLAVELPAGALMGTSLAPEITVASNHPRYPHIRVPITLGATASPAPTAQATLSGTAPTNTTRSLPTVRESAEAPTDRPSPPQRLRLGASR